MSREENFTFRSSQRMQWRTIIAAARQPEARVNVISSGEREWRSRPSLGIKRSKGYNRLIDSNWLD